MKKTLILWSIILSLLLVSCSSENADGSDNIDGYLSIGTEKDFVPIESNAKSGVYSENTLIYTNLTGETVQSYVKEILISAGIPEKCTKKVFEWVNDYNACMGKCEGFDLKDEFTSVSADAVDYGDYYPMSTLWYKTNKRSYSDILCRLAAFGLIGDSITVKKPIEEDRYECYSDDQWLYSDYDAINNNPLVDFDESEKEKYFSLYAPIEIEKECNEQEMYDSILKEWERRGISFDSIKCSLITIWLQDGGLTAAGHAAVLAENGDELLLFEKTNPQSPYQATRFSDLEQVKRYMFESVDLDNARYNLKTGSYIVMKNETMI